MNESKEGLHYEKIFSSINGNGYDSRLADRMRRFQSQRSSGNSGSGNAGSDGSSG